MRGPAALEGCRAADLSTKRSSEAISALGRVESSVQRAQTSAASSQATSGGGFVTTRLLVSYSSSGCPPVFRMRGAIRRELYSLRTIERSDRQLMACQVSQIAYTSACRMHCSGYSASGITGPGTPMLHCRQGALHRTTKVEHSIKETHGIGAHNRIRQAKCNLND